MNKSICISCKNGNCKDDKESSDSVYFGPTTTNDLTYITQRRIRSSEGHETGLISHLCKAIEEVWWLVPTRHFAWILNQGTFNLRGVVSGRVLTGRPTSQFSTTFLFLLILLNLPEMKHINHKNTSFPILIFLYHITTEGHCIARTANNWGS